jgi:leucine efflux protein
MFGITDYPAYLVAVLVFLAIPGPGNLALLSSTAKGGLRGGMAATLGVMAGDQVLIWAAVAGLATLLLNLPAVFSALQWLGAAYLAWLGLKMVMAKAGEAAVIDIPVGQYFRQSFFITLLNPKAIVFYMAFFPLFIDPKGHRGLLTFSVMAATAAALTFLYGLVVCGLADGLSNRLRGKPGLALWMNRLAGSLLIAFSVKLALGR